ncbi:MAG: hypothetical protein JWQ27_910 [Ferruginibacter sp.]|nr:hypothetical protein [Ferruginibacter sp.]
MKKLLVVAGLCFFAAGVSAQTSVKPVSVIAEVKLPDEGLTLKEAEYNFGKIPQGKPVTHVFEVTNTGKTPFKLDNVQASCGCTTPEWDREAIIAPGATSKITVGYNAAAEGPFTKMITITYNGTQSKQFQIKGEVWATPAASAPSNEGLKNLN